MGAVSIIGQIPDLAPVLSALFRWRASHRNAVVGRDGSGSAERVGLQQVHKENEQRERSGDGVSPSFGAGAGGSFTSKNNCDFFFKRRNELYGRNGLGRLSRR